MASPVQSLATHLINQTLNSIALLESLALISAPDAHLIRSKLPLASGPFSNLNPPLALPAQQHDLSPSFGGMTVGPSNSYDQQIRNSQQLPVTSPHPALPQRSRPAPSGVRAKVLWDYSGSEADDLSFRAGDMVIIDEEVNEQWYRGRLFPHGQAYPLDRSGLFPSNYVEKMSTQGPSISYFPPQPPPVNSNAMVPYQHSQQSSPYDYPKPDMHGQMVNYSSQQMIPPQQQVQGGVMLAPPEPKKHKYGKIGSQLGNAAVNGLGFGAGAAIAGDIVHAIF